MVLGEYGDENNRGWDEWNAKMAALWRGWVAVIVGWVLAGLSWALLDEDPAVEWVVGFGCLAVCIVVALYYLHLFKHPREPEWARSKIEEDA